jgi:uncharacterized repeat protein (TIGR04052 family)
MLTRKLAGIVLVTALFLPAAAAYAAFDANGQCVGDGNRDGEVTIEEIVGSVDSALQGCGFDPVSIRFRGAVGESTFACGQTYSGIGTTGADLIPSDFRFYVSNVRLVARDGREHQVLLDQDHTWQLEDLALLDFENKAPPCVNGTTLINDTVRGRVAPGEFTGIRFTLGVPITRNHGDASVAPPPLSLTGMFWSWQDGYKFIRIDTAFDNLRVHLGSTGCFYARPGVIGGCARPNRGEIFLTPFDPSTDVIVADLATLLEDSDINSNQQGTPPGCMSSPNDEDCEPILRNLGVSFENGLPSAATQKLFRVETGGR